MEREDRLIEGRSSYEAPEFVSRVPVWEAVKREWAIVVVPALLLLGLGLFVGLSRPPKYTAEARLTVGRLDVDPAALATFASATNSLASAYSRAVAAEPVVRRVTRKLKIPESRVRARVSATPVQDSPVIRVMATGKQEQPTVRLANATARALATYTTTLNRSNADSTLVLKQYRKASLDLSRASDRRDGLKQLGKGAVPKDELGAAEADVRSARLRVSSLATAYQSSQAGKGASQLVQPLSDASSADSDRLSIMEILAFAGLMAGLLIGIAVATVRANQFARVSLDN
jgi:capsular polysaccharide biosynthesis protein